MHKVLKDYLVTSRGDLYHIVGRIEQMVMRQYNKYRKDIASSKLSINVSDKGVARIHKRPALLTVQSVLHALVFYCKRTHGGTIPHNGATLRTKVMFLKLSM